MEQASCPLECSVWLLLESPGGAQLGVSHAAADALSATSSWLRTSRVTGVAVVASEPVCSWLSSQHAQNPVAFLPVSPTAFPTIELEANINILG